VIIKITRGCRSRDHIVVGFTTTYAIGANTLYIRTAILVILIVMVFNATFNNISIILWWSVLLIDETGIPREKN
jgi:hypothetical protein